MFEANSRVFLKGILLLAGLVLFAYLIELSPLGSVVNEAWIDNRVRGHGVTGEMLFLLLAGSAVAVGMPRQVISFLAGYAFDVALGTLFGLLATVLGCLLSFFFARWFGRLLLPSGFSGRLARIEAFIHDNTFTMTLLLRLLPAGSNLMLNLAAGFSRVRALPFISGSALGYIPQTLVFALVGSGVSVDPPLRIGMGLALLLASGLLGLYLYRKFQWGQCKNANTCNSEFLL